MDEIYAFEQVEIPGKYYREDGRPVYLDEPCPVKPCEYPSKFFASKGKPTIMIDYKSDTDIQSVATLLLSQVGTQDLDVKNVALFLALYGKTLKHPCPEDWSSFGVTIVKANHIADATSPLEVKYGEKVFPASTGPIVPEGKLKWLAFYCLMIYGINRINNESRRKFIMKEARKLQINFKSEVIKYEDLTSLYCDFPSTPDYRKLVASFDMFFYKFPGHCDSSLRFATSESRFRSCYALESFNEIKNLLHLSDSELCSWAFDREVHYLILGITHEGEEKDKPDSYFPYQDDLGLVRKSVYSSSNNPALHLWLHIIGSLMNHKSSINAKAFYVGKFFTLTYDAALLVLAIGTSGNLDYPLEEEVKVLAAQDQTPKSTDSTEWARFASKKRNKIFPSMWKLLQLRKVNLASSREKTIGKALSQEIDTWDRFKESAQIN